MSDLLLFPLLFELLPQFLLLAVPILVGKKVGPDGRILAQSRKASPRGPLGWGRSGAWGTVAVIGCLVVGACVAARGG